MILKIVFQRKQNVCFKKLKILTHVIVLYHLTKTLQKSREGEERVWAFNTTVVAMAFKMMYY